MFLPINNFLDLKHVNFRHFPLLGSLGCFLVGEGPYTSHWDCERYRPLSVEDRLGISWVTLL